MKRLQSVFEDGTDEGVLRSCSQALTVFCRGNQSRSDDAVLAVKDIVSGQIERVRELLSERDQLFRSKKKNSGSDLVDIGSSFVASLRRLRLLSQRIDISSLLDNEEKKGADEIESFCALVFKSVSDDLVARKPEVRDDDTVDIPKIWNSIDERVHTLVADAVEESVTLVTSIAATLMLKELGRETSNENIGDEEAADHIVVRLRDGLVKLVGFVFNMYVEQEASPRITGTVSRTLNRLQIIAARAAGDLRSLFVRDLAHAKSPFLRSCALTGDILLVGGAVRLMSVGNVDAPMDDVLLSHGRAICSNWNKGNRREAGVVLSYITHSDPLVASIATTIARSIRKSQPVRLLEAHMACLRYLFNKWLESQVDEPEDDRPSEEDLIEYENAVEKSNSIFKEAEQLAQRLSSSLGVGKLHDKDMSNAVFGLVKEGVRFAFSSDEPGYQSLEVGEFLPFLSLVAKYTNWVRNSIDRDHFDSLRTLVDRKEAELREDPDYSEIPVSDLEHLKKFRISAGMSKFQYDDDASLSQSRTGTEYDTEGEGQSATSSFRRRLSHAGSVSTIQTKTSVRSGTSALSPLKEESTKAGDAGSYLSSGSKRKLDSDDSSADESTPLSKRGRKSRRAKSSVHYSDGSSTSS